MQPDMSTEDGNRAVRLMLFKVETWVESGRYTRGQLANVLRREMRRVAKTHSEVHDTEQETYIVEKINEVCDRLGWADITRDEMFWAAD